MYPVMPMHGLHTLRHNFDADKYAEHQITNAYAIFDDSDHAGDQRTRRSLTSVLATLNGVVVDYKHEQQGCMSLHSTDGEIIATLAGAKKGVYFFELAKFLDLPSAGQPIKIYQDSQPCIDICNNGIISNRAKHIAVPALYIHDKVTRKFIELEYIPTSLQPADPGTKAQSAPVIFRAYDYAIGVRFYPPATSEHAQLMDLTKFNASRNFQLNNDATH